MHYPQHPEPPEESSPIRHLLKSPSSSNSMMVESLSSSNQMTQNERTSLLGDNKSSPPNTISFLDEEEGAPQTVTKQPPPSPSTSSRISSSRRQRPRRPPMSPKSSIPARKTPALSQSSGQSMLSTTTDKNSARSTMRRTTSSTQEERVNKNNPSILTSTSSKNNYGTVNNTSSISDDNSDDSAIQPKQNGVGSTNDDNNGSSGRSRGWKILQRYMVEGELALKVDEARASPTKIRKRQSQIRQQLFDEFHSGTQFSIEQCVIAIVGYICVSILLFSFFLEPQWSVVDSAYFAVTTFTTLGYGDMAPTSTISRLFTCAYALLGVITLGLALGILGNRIIERYQHAECRAEEMHRSRIMSIFESDRSINATNLSSTAAALMMPCNGNASSTRSRIYDKQKIAVTRLIILVVMMLSMAVSIGSLCGWSMMDTIYYLIVTGCTIGYGDLTPTTETGRLLAIVFIPLACGVTGHGIGYIAQNMISKKENDFLSQYRAKELTQDDLDAMDTTGDGKVSWAEFLEFMLVAMNKIDYELVDELQAHFQRLDVAGTGELSRADLAEMARRKLMNPRRKLELANYKHHLLEVAMKERNERNRSRFFGGWLPQLFRKHDNIRQPWRHRCTTGQNCVGRDNSYYVHSERNGMKDACDEVATMMMEEGGALEAPQLRHCSSVDYVFMPSRHNIRHLTRQSMQAESYQSGKSFKGKAVDVQPQSHNIRQSLPV